MQKKCFCYYCAHGLTQKKIEGRVRLFCEKCALPLYENPLPAACLMVVDQNNKLLLVKRSVQPRLGFWCLPGGFMELGESPEETALRELKEETALNGESTKLFQVAANHSDQYHTVIIICYLVKKFSGVPQAGDDASQVKWWSREELPEIAFSSHDQFINAYYKIN